MGGCKATKEFGVFAERPSASGAELVRDARNVPLIVNRRREMCGRAHMGQYVKYEIRPSRDNRH